MAIISQIPPAIILLTAYVSAKAAPTHVRRKCGCARTEEHQREAGESEQERERERERGGRERSAAVPQCGGGC